MKSCTALACVLAFLCVSGEAAETARYQNLELDRPMTRWLVLGPVPVAENATPDDDAQQKAFADDLLAAAGGEAAVDPASSNAVRLAGKERKWRAVRADADVVDVGTDELAVAYAWAEIEMPEAARVVLGLGSDDAVKVWVNGTLVHERWGDPSRRPEEDVLGADLRKGRNRLLLKVQNTRGEWGFTCRRLGPQQQMRRLLAAARTGDLGATTVLLEGGAAVDGHGPGEITAVHVAKLHGRRAMVEFLVSRGANAAAAIPPPEPLVDALFDEAFQADGPGAAVLVAKNGEILFEKAYGRSDVRRRIAAGVDSKFRIGSVTKPFTAAAILKLHEQGRLGLQDKLSKFIPDYPRGGEVTIHHLLTHTSGIHNFTRKPEFYASATQGATAEEHIAFFKGDPYDFTPGERWSYNNSGYFLLGYIVEKVSGQSYADYLRQTFFEPLGMRDTGVHVHDSALPREALGYSVAGDRTDRAADWDMSRVGGAGALYSTVRDLYRWNEAIFGGRVLPDATLAAAFAPVVTADDDPTAVKDTGYGYGWAIQRLRGALEISHGGAVAGFESYLLRMPESRLTVAVLLNSSPPPPGVDPAVMAREVAELYLGASLAVRETPKVDPRVSAAALAAVEGSYDLFGATLTITREGGRIFAQMADQAKNEIFPRSDTAFFMKERDREITFVKDARGHVTKALLTNQAGQSVSAARKEEEKLAPVDPSSYDAYVGRYDYGNATLTVTRERDRLMAQLTGQPKFEIFPRSDTTFFWKVISAEITFVKDDKGSATKAIHKQGGRTFEAPRLRTPKS